MMRKIMPQMVDIPSEDIIGVWREGTNYTIISQKKVETPSLQFYTTSALPAHLESQLFDLPLHLQIDVHVIISVSSGTGLATQYYTQIISPLLSVLGVSFRPFYTSNCDSIKEIVPSLSGTVILLSGDGGVNDIINFASSRLTIVLFPMGSGNALYHSHIKNGLHSLLRGSSQSLPNFRAMFEQANLSGKQLESMLGAVILSYGFHATLVEESEKYRHDGEERFLKVAEALLKNPRTYVGSVNQEVMRGYAAATLVKKLDKDFTISPKNELRLIHVDTSNLMKGYSEGLGAWKVDKVDFHAQGKMCLDGSIIEVNGEVLVEMAESVVDLVV
ncbi:putative cortical actin cytoskeleton protein vip1 [Erysiphe neolycopersici]|uniref:Putative cortical actin cytoskeleton protein vip1 n=1 Tax=Erysiphe neolycopersici TaxID=212602 RepID=A0A420HNH7_9PEZI|nr:putative cortical actin cytoskeleton protein vip1 [Erysiphe neolycopersici]